MDAAVLEQLQQWVGRSRGDEDLISVRHARLMAATVDFPRPERIAAGAPLPPLWHWIYFLEGSPAGELGRDGHPARGGFLPPVPLANRMWAGGRVSFVQPVLLGASLRKESSILKVEYKRGRTGDLVFVTVLHALKTLAGELCVREEHDIVYKEASPSAPAAPAAAARPADVVTRSYTPSSTMLFRYSALTFNGHRIHYDVDYCREVEGYHNLVIHGPLNATMLANFAEEVAGRRVVQFSYRGVSPALLGSTITLQARIDGKHVELQAVLDSGVPCMQAEALIE